MKKISLKNLDALGIEKLSRESLKDVTGGGLCGFNEFACHDGTCIPKYKVMDGVMDCMDGWDEQQDPGGGTTSCSCTLKSSTGVTLNIPTSSGWNTSELCDSGCNNACAEARRIGGDCASYLAVFGSN